MRGIILSVLLFLFITITCSCIEREIKKQKLPFLGEPIIRGKDSIFPTIQNFTFINQDSNIVNNSTFSNKIYVADFIFLSCPSICPKMNTEMLKVYSEFENNDTILFLSHTIDPDRDSISRLKKYSQNINVKSSKWHFVTGNKDSIYKLAEHSYFSNAYEDSLAEGGYVHSGGLLLIDKNRHIRGVYDGTDELETVRLINDIRVLLKE
jgi:protein SCO1/2